MPLFNISTLFVRHYRMYLLKSFHIFSFLLPYPSKEVRVSVCMILRVRYGWIFSHLSEIIIPMRWYIMWHGLHDMTYIVISIQPWVWNKSARIWQKWFVSSLIHSWKVLLQWLPWRHNGCDGVSNHQPDDFCSTLYSGADKRKRQSSASLVFVWRIHRWPVNSSHKGPVTRQMFPFHDVTMEEFFSGNINAWMVYGPRTLASPWAKLCYNDYLQYQINKLITGCVIRWHFAIWRLFCWRIAGYSRVNIIRTCCEVYAGNMASRCWNKSIN